LVAMSTRLSLQPATVSYLLLALALWLVRPQGEAAGVPSRPPWPLALLFLVWANVDAWFVLGLATVALVWLGQALDAARQGGHERGAWASDLGRLVLCPLALGAVCLLNPFELRALLLDPSGWRPFALPAELGGLLSPFQEAYFDSAGRSPASLA